MKRDKEIKQASKEFCSPYEDEKLFQRGARWADKTMIDKATQWLFENVFYYPEESYRVELFRKAMEE